MAERSKRQPAAGNTGKSKVSGALAALTAAREGGRRRGETFEIENEEAVYDVVDEEEYAKLVAKRRVEADEFLVDGGEDDGYMDLGEEDDFWNGAPPEDEGQGPGRKRKDGKGADGGLAKKKATEPQRDPKARERMQKMFMNAQARAPLAIPATDASSDALLEDILGGLGEGPTPGSGARVSGGGQHAKPSHFNNRTPPLSRPSGGRPFVGLSPPGRTSCMMTSPVMRHELQCHVDHDRAAAGGDDCIAAAKEGDQPMDEISHKNSHQLENEAEESSPTGRAPLPPTSTAVTPEAINIKGEPKAEDFVTPGAPTGPEITHGPPTAPPARLFVDSPMTPAMLQASAATGWQEMYSTEWQEEGAAVSPVVASKTPGEDLSPMVSPQVPGTPPGPLQLDSEGNLPFFFLDAYENPDQPGTVYLFGKVKAPGPSLSWQSCCAVLANLHYSLLVIPTEDIFKDEDGELALLEAAAAADPEKKIDLVKHLHGMCSSLKAEVRDTLMRHNIHSMRMVPVKRKYAFENPLIPQGDQYVLKVRYPGKDPALPSGLHGKHFRTITGCQGGLLEPLILKRGLKGPSLIVLKDVIKRESGSQVSWCKVEVEVPSPKHIITNLGGTPGCERLLGSPPPPLVVASINLKLHLNPKNQQNEVVSASVVYLQNVNMDAPMAKEEWNTSAQLKNFSIIRKMDGQTWPPGFEGLVARENASPRGKANGGNMIMTQPNERALLTCLLTRLQGLDPDVLVGHNISAFDLNVLLHRLQQHKLPIWSRVGRLKRNHFPKLTGGGNVFGGGASQGVMTALAGRLLCDTYLSSRELLREVDYTLKTLANVLLSQDRHELPPPEVVKKYETAEGLRALMMHGESDAWLSLGIMFQLSVLPLTKQLTNLSGSLWNKTLQGQRAQRIEMLLLHEFHDRKFILPDKMSYKEKEKARQANKSQHEGQDPHDGDEVAEEGPSNKGTADASKKAKGPQYLGGLVLEPKKGLYDKIILLLDFNSLYPSIIQEYNICFTTVQRPKDGSIPPLPEPSSTLAPLPTVIQHLVQRRRQVKSAMAGARDPVHRQQLNIRQQALKLTANSMYGCLGFTNSRFYAKPLAELITSRGRDILQSTVDLVQDMPGLEVIYGDTDSIMVNSNTDDLAAARQLGNEIKKQVNKRYKLLEIELDGIFKCMLLLKKKKYAAKKLEPGPDGGVREVIEQKGLDIVRRDWCGLSKDVGNFVLEKILSGRPKEEVVEEIHNHLREVRKQLDAGQVPLGKFVITKQLTKRPEDYPDAKAQPHVQVALRRRTSGKRDGVMAGETVPYIICVEKDEEGNVLAGSKGIAERAYHLEEIKENPLLDIDKEYYLVQQVHPVVARLCAPIEGSDAARLADCLGLDASKYRGSSTVAGAEGEDLREEALMVVGSVLDSNEHYKNCTPLVLKAPNGTTFELKGVREMLKEDLPESCFLTPPDAVGDPTQALTGPQLANQIMLRSRELITQYYQGWMASDDEVNPWKTRDPIMRPPEGPRGTMAHPNPKVTAVLSRCISEQTLYNQLSYYHRLVDVEGALSTVVDPKKKEAIQHKLSPLRPILDLAANSISLLRDSSAYHWVDLEQLLNYKTHQ